MLLTYSNKRFPPLIEAGVKIHSIREDKNNRWKVGMKIDHWMHSPRNPSKHPYPFLKGKHVLISKQQIEILPYYKDGNCYSATVVVDNTRLISMDEIENLSYNDGLENTRMFFKWFDCFFKGYILHWTTCKY
jgi:hypothetical protein